MVSEPDSDTMVPLMLPPPEIRLGARAFPPGAVPHGHQRDHAVLHERGYRSRLVPGTTVYAYMTRPLVAAWGLEWLARGTAELALLQPVQDGDELTIRTRIIARSGGEVAGEMVAEVTALTGRGVAATLLASRAWGGPPLVPDPAGYPAAPLPEHASSATEATLAALDRLGSPELSVDERELAGYAAAVADPLPIYRGPEAVAHPGLLLHQADRALAENVALGPWSHVASHVVHCRPARIGERVSTRGRVGRRSAEHGQGLVELDLLMVADRTRPVLWVRHTASYWLGGAGSPPPR